VGIDELAEVVDFVVDDAPEVFGRVVRGDRIAREGGVRHVDGVWEGGDGWRKVRPDAWQEDV